VFPNKKRELLMGCTEDRRACLQAAQKGGLRERVGRAVEKGNPPARPFPQPSLMCSPLARPVVQPALLCRLPAHGKFIFLFWQYGPSARWPSV